MRICSMRATFGKLANEQLCLEEGLNVFEAPNEWGKSTWCAFLVAMLYGIDTKERSKQGALADKERYAPWSGQNMSGSMTVEWQGRQIVIERTTRGRSILGEFKAYEADSGLPVRELNAANCGQVLLGVEKSVFLRSAFIRLTDMPVTQDEALRRRLNALVTTGDESGAAEALAQKLKELKNKCRFNRSGLLPQAEAQRSALQQELQQRLQEEESEKSLRHQLSQLEAHLAQLKNHDAALLQAEARQSSRRAEQAAAERDAALQLVRQAEDLCQGLPPQQVLEQQKQQLDRLTEDYMALQMDAISLPRRPEPPQIPLPLTGLTPEQALLQVQQDGALYAKSPKTGSTTLWAVLAVLFAAAAGILFYLQITAGAIACAGGFLAGLVLCILGRSKAAATQALANRYGSGDPANWMAMAEDYAAAQQAYLQQCRLYEASQRELSARKQALEEKKHALFGNAPLKEVGKRLEEQLSLCSKLTDARREWVHAQKIADSLAALAKPVRHSVLPDTLTWTQAETARLISDTEARLRQLQMELGQVLGRKEKLADPHRLQQALKDVDSRIASLEDHYSALSLALQALQEASDQLQRRFAPKLTRRAQELFARLTGGRYHRLLLKQDMSAEAGAAGEDTLRSALWRSDGTADQLYLALRLAVAEELMCESPLILDDALLRFDDTRLKNAMEILEEMGKTRQILLFSCQDREKRIYQG